jgi:hypothetical protein
MENVFSTSNEASSHKEGQLELFQQKNAILASLVDKLERDRGFQTMPNRMAERAAPRRGFKKKN